MTKEITCAEFKEELDTIKDDIVRDIATKIMERVAGKMDEEIATHSKRVAKIAASIGASRGYQGLALDVVTAAALLHDAYKNEKGELHPMCIRLEHRDILSEIDPGIAETLCSLVEGHEGFNSIIPKLAAKEGTIEQILCDANTVEKLEL